VTQILRPVKEAKGWLSKEIIYTPLDYGCGVKYHEEGGPYSEKPTEDILP